MGRHKLLHEQVSRMHSFERDRYREFEQLCKEKDVSVSEGLRMLIEGELEKKVKGDLVEPNPLNLPRNTIDTYVCNPKNPSQSDLREWLPRKEAINKAKRIPLDVNDWRHLKETFQIIYDKKRTGYL